MHVAQAQRSSAGQINTTFPTVERLAEGELMAAEILHVVFFKSPADHLGCVVLTGQLGVKQ